MRGPVDDVIEEKQSGAALVVAPDAKESTEYVPLPGWKPLARLLFLLESAGYEEAVAEVVEAAVNDENKEGFEARAVQFSADPSGETAALSVSAPKKTTGNGSAKKGSSKDSKKSSDASAGTAAENIASMYLEASDHLGPPTATGPQWRSLGPWTVPNGQT